MSGFSVQYFAAAYRLIAADRILGHDGCALADDELVDAVVDLGVHMVGAASQHNDVAAFPAGGGDDLGALVPQLLHVAVVLVIRGVDGLMHGLFVKAGEVFIQRLGELFVKVLAALEIEVVVDQPGLGQLGAVALEHLGVVGDDRTVIVVVAEMLVEVVAHAGVEHGVDALLAQPLDMAVAQLGGEAGRIAGDGGLPALVQLAVGERADRDLEAELGEQRMPERQQLVHI